MTIGICRIELYLPECGSLKAKRSVLKSLCARIQNKFNVSVSELSDNDLWQKALLGVAVIANESKYANQVLSGVVDLVRSDAHFVMMDYTVEML